MEDMYQKSALRPGLCRPPAVVGIGAKANVTYTGPYASDLS